MSLSYIGAMLLSNWALSFMSYPAQSLAKSCKLIPVMLARIIINKARYELREYVQVALITGGISVFMTYQPGVAVKDTSEAQEFTVLSLTVDASWVGLALCFVALALDGYTVRVTHNTSIAQLACTTTATATHRLPCACLLCLNHRVRYRSE